MLREFFVLSWRGAILFWGCYFALFSEFCHAIVRVRVKCWKPRDHDEHRETQLSSVCFSHRHTKLLYLLFTCSRNPRCRAVKIMGPNLLWKQERVAFSWQVIHSPFPGLGTLGCNSVPQERAFWWTPLWHGTARVLPTQWLMDFLLHGTRAFKGSWQIMSSHSEVA